MNVALLDICATDAPWKVRENEEFGLHITDGCGVIAKIGPCGKPDETDYANAKLIVHVRNHFMETLDALKAEIEDQPRTYQRIARLRELVVRLENARAEIKR